MSCKLKLDINHQHFFQIIDGPYASAPKKDFMWRGALILVCICYLSNVVLTHFWRAVYNKVWCRNSILLTKLFWHTVRKNCSLQSRKTFEIWGWRLRICKIFEVTWTFFFKQWNSEQFLLTKCFLNLFLEVSQI